MAAPLDISTIDWTDQDCATLCRHVQQYGAQDWAAVASTLKCSATLCTLKWNVMFLQCFPIWGMTEYSAWELGVLLLGYKTLSGVYGTLRQMHEVIAGWLPGRTRDAVRESIKLYIRDQRDSPLNANEYPGTLVAMLEAWPGPRSDCQVNTQVFCMMQNIRNMQTLDTAVAASILERLQLLQASTKTPKRSGRSRSTTPLKGSSSSRKRSALQNMPFSVPHMTPTRDTSSSPTATAAVQRPLKRRSLFQTTGVTKTSSLDSRLTMEISAAPDAADWRLASHLAASHGPVLTDIYGTVLALQHSSNHSATAFAAQPCSDLAHKDALRLDGMSVQAWTVPGPASISIPAELQLSPSTALPPRYPPLDQQLHHMTDAEIYAACMFIESPVDPLPLAATSIQSQPGHVESHMPPQIKQRRLHGSIEGPVVPAGYIPAGWCLQTGVEAVCMPDQQESQQDNPSHQRLGVAASSQVDIWEAFMRFELQIPPVDPAKWPTGVQGHLQQAIAKFCPAEPEQCLDGIESARTAAAAAALEPCSAKLLCSDQLKIDKVAPIIGNVVHKDRAPSQAEVQQLNKTATSDVMLGAAASSRVDIWERLMHFGLELPPADQTDQPTGAQEPCKTKLICADQPTINEADTIGVNHRGTAAENIIPCQAGMPQLSKTAVLEATLEMLSCPMASAAADGVSFRLSGTAPEGVADPLSWSQHSSGYRVPSFEDVHDLDLQVLGPETVGWEEFHELRSATQCPGQPEEQHCTMQGAPVSGVRVVGSNYAGGMGHGVLDDDAQHSTMACSANFSHQVLASCGSLESGLWRVA